MAHARRLPEKKIRLERDTSATEESATDTGITRLIYRRCLQPEKVGPANVVERNKQFELGNLQLFVKIKDR